VIARGYAHLSTWYDVRIVADGSTLKVYRDGEEILSATDSSIGTGRVALICSGNSDAYFDDVLVTSLEDPETTTYEYNTANELTKQTVGGSTITDFYYDTWGRMVSKGQGSYSDTYAYKYGGKLVSITSYSPAEGTTYVYYEYGGDGKRRERSSTNRVSYTWYNWDAGFNVISEEDESGRLEKTYVGRLAHIEGSNPSSGTYRYYFHDHLGSVRNVKNDDKSLYASYEYTPYGQLYSHSGSDVKRRFTGQEWDDDAKLYYFPFRYYGPGTARWITRDPFWAPNLYRYANAKPVTHVDPLGLEVCQTLLLRQWYSRENLRHTGTSTWVDPEWRLGLAIGIHTWPSPASPNPLVPTAMICVWKRVARVTHRWTWDIYLNKLFVELCYYRCAGRRARQWTTRVFYDEGEFTFSFNVLRETITGGSHLWMGVGWRDNCETLFNPN